MEEIFAQAYNDFFAALRRGGRVFVLGAALGLMLGLFSSIIVMLATGAKGKSAEVLGSSFVLTFLAFISGHLTGNTRETVIGDVAPALLAGSGALFALSFLQSRIQPLFAGYLAFVFASFFFFGVVLGGHHRELAKSAEATRSQHDPQLRAVEIETPPRLPTEDSFGSNLPSPAGDSSPEVE